METTIQKISVKLKVINNQLSLFLEQYSKVKRIYFPGDSVFSLSGDYSFEDLPSESIVFQDKLFKDFNLHMDLIDVLVINSPAQYKKGIKDNKNKILKYILQNGMLNEKGIPQVVLSANQSFQKINDLFIQLFPDSNPRPILIPDTNALYHNTEIENWSFSDFQTFTIVLTPSVLRDLDKHKIEHKNELVRAKALKLIRKIKEYRRRGKLLDGVTLTKDKIDLLSVGVEPNFELTLKWLDEKNEDDRLIAESLEIMRSYCNRPVILVTTDINLQNKCDVADLAYIEPPEL